MGGENGRSRSSAPPLSFSLPNRHEPSAALVSQSQRRPCRGSSTGQRWSGSRSQKSTNGKIRARSPAPTALRVSVASRLASARGKGKGRQVCSQSEGAGGGRSGRLAGALSAAGLSRRGGGTGPRAGRGCGAAPRRAHFLRVKGYVRRPGPSPPPKATRIPFPAFIYGFGGFSSPWLIFLAGPDWTTLQAPVPSPGGCSHPHVPTRVAFPLGPETRLETSGPGPTHPGGIGPAEVIFPKEPGGKPPRSPSVPLRHSQPRLPLGLAAPGHLFPLVEGKAC